MSASSDPIDPYHEWLGIAPHDQPPTYYRLLGVEEFETDLAIIEQAAKKRVAHLHPMSSGPNRDSVQLLLREVAKARRTLLSDDSKSAYDASLREKREADEVTAPPRIETGSAKEDAIASTTLRSETPTPGRRRKRDLRLATGLIAIMAGGILVVLYRNRDQGDTAMNTNASVPAEIRQSESSDASATRPASKNGRKKSPDGRESGRDKKSPGRSTNTREKQSRPPTSATQDSRDAPGTNRSNEASVPSRRNNRKNSASNRNPKTLSPQLAEDWQAGLTPLSVSAFQIKKGADLLSDESSRLRLLPAGQATRTGSVLIGGVMLELNQTAAVSTNFRAGLPDAMKVGLRVGPLRLQLESKGKNIQIKMLQKSLGSLQPTKGKRLTIAISRDRTNFHACQWIVTDGTKTIGGRVRVNGEAGLSVPVGVFFSTSKRKLEDPIWIGEARTGTLTQPFLPSPSQIINIKIPDK